jgi:hypothetical protein
VNARAFKIARSIAEDDFQLCAPEVPMQMPVLTILTKVRALSLCSPRVLQR